jgi:tyrosine-protein kinase Etk/Wzc
METRSTSEEELVRDAWWSTLGALYDRRRFLFYVTSLVTVASVIISLLLPKWYESTAQVLLPSGGSSGGLGALVGNLDPAAAMLLGGTRGDYVRFRAILNSNTMFDRVIEEFNLMDVYDNRDSKTPIDDTRDELESNVEFGIDPELDFLYVSAMDRDPVKSAEMANFFVDELNRMNIELSTESASAYRAFVQRRYDETIANLDSSMAVLQHFQEEHGLIGLEQQSAAVLEILTQYRAASFQAEIEYEALVLDFGKDNPTVRSARNRVEAAREKERQLLEGGDPLMPVALSDLPEVGRGYAAALRDVAIYQKIIEYARPVLEQAIFEEQREAPAVQVLDRAKVPEWKTKPKRALIVIGSTLSAFILVVLYVITMHWLRTNRAYFVSRIEAELSRKR